MQDQFAGCLVGLAVGDALGAPVETLARAEVMARHGSVTEMLGGGRLGLKPGMVTDDTETMLCVLDSYIAGGGFDPNDIAERLLEWYRSDPMDIDSLTREACENLFYGYNFERAGQDAHFSMPPEMRQGNASLPRCVPAALLHYHDHVHLVGESRVISGITHFDERCKLGCVALSMAIAHQIMVGPDGLIEELLEFIGPRNTPLAYMIEAVPQLRVEELRSTSSVIDTLQAAIWASIYCDEFEEGLVLLAGLGGDADTVCAVAGALLGARLGIEAIPQRWLEPLQHRERIQTAALKLFSLSEEN